MALLHEIGCVTLLEGIENEVEASMAIEAGVDFVQGFYFARPTRNLHQEIECLSLLGGQMERQAKATCALRTHNQSALEPYIVEFRKSAGSMAFSSDPSQVSTQLLVLPGVLRSYVLDKGGNQVGCNLQTPLRELNSDPRFYPVSNPVGASWAMRPYYQRAMADPGNIQVSRPYFSITDASMCITLSVRLKNADDEVRICCLDIMWDDGGES